jgi:mono/diheme cytochrome c family protein
MHRTVVALLTSLAAVTLADAAWAIDLASGEKVARRWCAACHVVATDQRQGNTQAAPFSEMAKLPGLDAGQVALYLLAPHPKMPDMSLTRKEAADLAGYILKQGH